MCVFTALETPGRSSGGEMLPTVGRHTVLVSSVVIYMCVLYMRVCYYPLRGPLCACLCAVQPQRKRLFKHTAYPSMKTLDGSDAQTAFCIRQLASHSCLVNGNVLGVENHAPLQTWRLWGNTTPANCFDICVWHADTRQQTCWEMNAMFWSDKTMFQTIFRKL